MRMVINSIFELLKDVTTTDFATYTDTRYKIGMAEGSNEIEFGKAFPLEYNLGM